MFLKALYINTSLKIGRKIIHPNRGLLQGSTISPLLFDFCIDHLLRLISSKLNMNVDQILGYADDLSFLCISPNQLKKTIDLLESESPKIGRTIKKRKSAIIEIRCRKYARPRWNLLIGKNLKGIPIVSNYPYLGSSINRKLDVEETFMKIKLSINHILKQLAPLLSKASLDFQINIWKTFINPLLEMGAISYISSTKKTAKTKVDKFIKRSLKTCLNFPPKGDDKYLDYLFPNLWNKKCLFILKRCKLKWRIRKGENNIQIPKFQSKSEFDTKYLPNNFMTLIKAFASKCKYCGNFRVSPHHLKHNHSIDIQLFSIESPYLEWKQAKKAWGDLTRDMIVQNGELFVQAL